MCVEKRFLCGFLSFIFCSALLQTANAQTSTYDHAYGRMERMLKRCNDAGQAEHMRQTWPKYIAGSLGWGVFVGSFLFRSKKKWIYLTSLGAALVGFTSADRDERASKAKADLGAIIPKKPWYRPLAWKACEGLFTAELNMQDGSITFWEKGHSAGVTCLLNPGVEVVLFGDTFEQPISTPSTLKDTLRPLSIQKETCHNTLVVTEVCSPASGCRVLMPY